MKIKKKNQQAFTLIELLVVATIIIILTTLGLVSYRTAMKRSKQARCQADIEAVRQALVMHRSDEGSYSTVVVPPALWSALIGDLSDYLPTGESLTAQLPAVYTYNGSVVTATNCGGEIFTASLP